MALTTFTAGQILTAAQLNAALATLLSHDAWTSYIPALTQSNSPTKTSNSTYLKLGRLVVARFHLTLSSLGTAANAVSIGLPPFASVAPVNTGIGVFMFYDNGTQFHAGTLIQSAATTVTMLQGGVSQAGLGATGSPFTAALAVGDIIAGTVMYEATS